MTQTFNTQFNSLIELTERFRTEKDCIKYLEELFWDGEPVSPYDENSRVYKCGNGKYKCNNTGKYFTVLTNTPFKHTRIPLRKWFMAMYLVANHKKGISSCQLARDIKVTQMTAWRMLHKLRQCFAAENFGRLSGIVEVDETYVGGSSKNMHFAKKLERKQSGWQKAPVLGMVEREGNAVAYAVPNVEMDTLNARVLKHVRVGSFLYTDELAGYKRLNRFYHREYVNHGKGNYVKKDNRKVYTNSIESLWALLKRMIKGIYHVVSPKYLQNYVNECIFRYNTRKMTDTDRFIWGLHILYQQ